MNNNTPAVIRSLIIYAVIIPLAIWIGYLLAAPADRDSFSIWGIMALILCAPLLLRWHHFLLIATWNTGLMIFFLPGNPQIWLLMVALSLGLSVLHRTVNSEARFISAPSIARPLICLIGVILITAKLRGGIGIHSLGNDTAGGRNYILLLVGIIGYFALTAQRIPPHKAKLYISLFFLSGCTSFISDLAPFLPAPLHFIFAFFPMSLYDQGTSSGYVEFHPRYAGLGALGTAGVLFMMARYGVRGILAAGHLWRAALFGIFGILILFGGFRSAVLFCGIAFAIQFFLEKVHRTRIFTGIIFIGLIGLTLMIAFSDKLPFSVQRSLAFLPLKLEQYARDDAEGSKEWRLKIWKDALPTVPKYLLLGKGYALSKTELDIASSLNFRYVSNLEEVEIVGNYHSGPLSVIIPLGIWGVIAIIWFWIASLRALYFNYRYGNPAVRTINIFLLALFISKVFSFLIIFGSLFSDMYYFAALIGLNVSINGGVCRPVAVPVPVQSFKKSPASLFARPHLQPSFPR